MERRFFIAEVPEITPGWKISLESITEAELIDRLNYISNYSLVDMKQKIQYLLHGEKEQAEMPRGK